MTSYGMVGFFQENLVDIMFNGPSRPLQPDDEFYSDSSYEHPDDIRRLRRKERRYTERKLQGVIKEERAHSAQVKARMKQPDMALLFGRARPNLRLSNKFAKLDDLPVPASIGFEEYETSIRKKPPLRNAQPVSSLGTETVPPPGLEHVVLVPDKPATS